MHRLILAGSPRSNGRTAALADELFNACIEECPNDGVSIVAVSSVCVGGCTGCDGCKREGNPPAPLKDGDPLSPCAEVRDSTAALHQCVIADDMAEVRKHLDAADELVVVCPVYFAGAPSQFKALLDRLQPYFWSNMRESSLRPCVLHLVGEGHDPYGFEPLIQSLSSAVYVAGFHVELVLDWVGKITPEGEIIAEADEYPIPPVGGCAALGWSGADEWTMIEQDDELDDGVAEELQPSELLWGAQEPPAQVKSEKGKKPKNSKKGSEAHKGERKTSRARLDLGSAAPNPSKKSKSKGKGGRRG